MPKFNIYEANTLKPIATVTGANANEAQRTAEGTLEGAKPFTARMLMKPAEMRAYIEVNGFTRWQDRIGLAVYRDHGGKRAKRELTVGAERAYLYDLKDNRRTVTMQWDIGV